ncbi:hypothetical protein DHEL01_v201915 [Diaporthe helianthi]|uniref:Uncharacterized protein n=1 Tax=Diaporthe helianthi TaxID=158607 RepID=A0A2P5IAZ4_DIAHE|nr:hypothetical protein DHEL01_v201915 [Diaporthe helianthi]
MARYSVPVSDARQKGGIIGGTVGAVLLVAVLTLFCCRRVRRRIQQSRGCMSLPESGSTTTTDDPKRGMVAHRDMFSSDDKTASTAHSLATRTPQISPPSVVTTTSEQFPICFRPSSSLISRGSSLLVTPRASTRLSLDHLRETVLLPQPLRLAGRTALVRSQSWQAVPRKQAARDGFLEHHDRCSGSQDRSRSRSRSMYSSYATFEFAEYVMIGPRISQGTVTATTERASGVSDASGLLSSIASFPRPPPFAFSGGDERGGLGTSWRESFVFLTPDDEVLLAFPELARQMEKDQ